jgi:hypothetical protein
VKEVTAKFLFRFRMLFETPEVHIIPDNGAKVRDLLKWSVTRKQSVRVSLGLKLTSEMMSSWKRMDPSPCILSVRYEARKRRCC